MSVFFVCVVIIFACVLFIRDKSQAWREQRWQMMSRILVVMMQIKICCLEATLSPLVTSLRR